VSFITVGGRKGERQVTRGCLNTLTKKETPQKNLGWMDGVRGRSRYAQFTSQSISVARKIPMRDGNEINKGRWSPRRDVWFLGRDSTLRSKVLRCTIRVETPQGQFLPRVALARVRGYLTQTFGRRMWKYSEDERFPCAKIRGRRRAPKITKNSSGCDLLYLIVIRLVFLNRKIFLRADASSSGHFFSRVVLESHS
jgi:hypothetical protein